MRKLLVMLCLILVAVSCTPTDAPLKEDAEQKEDVKQEEEKKEDAKKKIEYNDQLIKEVSKSGTYIDVDESKREYSYSFPMLVSNAPNAIAINDEIDKMLNDEMALFDRQSVRYDDIQWKSYWKDSVVSLVIIKSFMDSDVKDYAVYSYDFKTDKRLGNDDILNIVGMKKEDFITEVKKTIASEYYILNSFEEEITDEDALTYYYSNVLPLLPLELSRIESRFDDFHLYVDGDQLFFIVERYSAMDETFTDREAFINLKSNNKRMEKEVSESFIKAKLKDNRVYISFIENEDSNLYLNTSEFIEPIEYNKEYEVEGLMAEYKDIFIGSVGQDFFPYLVLVTTEGNIEFVDIISCAKYNLFVSLPAPGLSGVTNLYADIVDDALISIIVEDDIGNSYSLDHWIFASSKAIMLGVHYDEWLDSEMVTHRLDTQNSYTTVYSMLFSYYDFIITDQTLDVITEYMGTYFLLGVTEEGFVYQYYTNFPDENYNFRGIMLLRLASDERSDYFAYEYLEAKIIRGENLFDIGDDWLIFNIKYDF